MPHRNTQDTEGTVEVIQTKSVENNIITGPLGFWKFPLLNILLANMQQQNNTNTVRKEQSRSKLVVTEVHRDEDGRIQSIEEIEK